MPDPANLANLWVILRVVGGLRECFLVLDQMKQRRLHFDRQMAQVYEQLAAHFADGTSG